MLLPCFFAGMQDTTLSGGNLAHSVVVAEKERGHSDVVPIQWALRAPAVMGEPDVAKMLMFLPGITAGAEGDVGIRIRGGDFDQSHITLDGATIYNPAHLKGFLSIFDPRTISGATVYKDAFPASVGGRLSGGVAMEIKDGDFERWHGDVGVNFVNSGFSVNGPIVKGKTSFLIGGRISYFSKVAIPVLDKVFSSSGTTLDHFRGMDFWDVTAKLTHKFSDRDIIRFSLFNGRDTVAEKVQSYAVGKDVYTMSGEAWNSTTASLRYNHSGTDSRLMAGASYSSYGRRSNSIYNNYAMEIDGNRKEIHTMRQASSVSSEIKELSGTVDFSRNRSPLLNYSFGISACLQMATPKSYFEGMNITEVYDMGEEEIRVKYDSTGVVTPMKYKGYSSNLSLWAENDMSVTSWLGIKAGIRGMLYWYDGVAYGSFEPRIKIRFMPEKESKIDLAYSRMSQPITQLTTSNIFNSLDIWMPLTSEFGLMKADHYSLTVQRTFNVKDDPMNLSIAAYYKDMNNILHLKDGASLSMFDRWKSLVDVGRSWGYGVESMAEKMFGYTQWILAYTWSKTYSQFPNIYAGKVFLSDNDYRHKLTFNLSRQFGKHWDLSANFVYQTGRRYTLSSLMVQTGRPIELYEMDDPDYELIKQILQDRYEGAGTAWLEIFPIKVTYNERNKHTLPAYHRMDICCSYHIEHNFGESEIALSIYNLYNHQNAYSVFPAIREGKYVYLKTCLFPILPSISYRYSF